MVSANKLIKAWVWFHFQVFFKVVFKMMIYFDIDSESTKNIYHFKKQIIETCKNYTFL